MARFVKGTDVTFLFWFGIDMERRKGCSHCIWHSHALAWTVELGFSSFKPFIRRTHCTSPWGMYRSALLEYSNRIWVSNRANINSSFVPKSIEKWQTRTNKIEQRILVMYAKCMSQRDIEYTLREIYSSEISQWLISWIIYKILPIVNEWQNHPLEKIYPVVFFDRTIFNSRKDNKIVNKYVYSILSINMDGMKEILGTWISENKSASLYASIYSEFKNRGVSDIFIACHDNMTRICDAMNAVFLRTKNQPDWIRFDNYIT